MLVAFSVTMATENKDPGKKHSYTSVTEITAQGKRKSGGLFQTLKFWKKDRKNTRSLPQIGKPMQFQHVSGVSIFTYKESNSSLSGYRRLLVRLVLLSRNAIKNLYHYHRL